MQHLDAAFGQLLLFSESGPAVHRNYRRLLVPGYPYGNFYTIEDRGIIVTAVLDLRQNPAAVINRLSSFGASAGGGIIAVVFPSPRSMFAITTKSAETYTMKLSSLFTGDLADLFQDARIDEARDTARVASTSASINLRQVHSLAGTVEKRIQEVESENAVLGLIIVRLLRELAGNDPALVEKVVDDVRAQLASAQAAPRGIDFLKQALDLPTGKKTPISLTSRPLAKPPRPPEKPKGS